MEEILFVVHGGDAATQARALGIALGDVVDASANIAPIGPSPTVEAVLARFAADPSPLRRYPDPEYTDLRRSVGRHLNVDPERIVVGNGSAALIGAALTALNVRNAALPVPSFSEYRKALATGALRVFEFQLAAERSFLPDVDTLTSHSAKMAPGVCIIANPNNPTGAVLPSAKMVDLVWKLRAVGVATIVDEAFIDYAAAAAIDLEALPPRSIVLRSITKFHAVPGIRFGYAVTDAATAAAMRSALPSWCIGAIDAAIAEAIIDGGSDNREALLGNARRRRALRQDLETLGIRVFPSAANFLFCDARQQCHSSSQTLRFRLLHDHHVLIRPCDDYQGLPDGCFVRIAVLDDRQNFRIVRALADSLTHLATSSSAVRCTPSATGLPSALTAM